MKNYVMFPFWKLINKPRTEITTPDKINNDKIDSKQNVPVIKIEIGYTVCNFQEEIKYF